jgi:hypothetical protein
MNRITLVGCFILAACMTPIDAVVPPPDDPCQGVTCSERGQCTTLRAAAICVCNAGSFAEGLECKAIVAGAECEGVTCNGRGSCVVLSGMPNSPKCECDADSVSAGATTCVAKPEPCAGIDCGGHGTCAVSGGAPLCSCEAGYDRLGTTCVARAVPDGGAGPCAGVTCSGRGQCGVLGGSPPTAACFCNAGYVASGLACVLQGTVGGGLTLLAGALGGQGYADGTVDTRFDLPNAVAHDATGNVYVTGQTIRKMTPSGSVSTLAGLAGPGNAGSVDGVGSAARFTDARFPVFDSAGNLLVVDGQRLRKVTPSGVVSTVLQSFDSVSGMTIDANDNLWTSGVCVSGGNSGPCLRKVTPGGVITSRTLTFAPGVTGSNVSPGQVSVSADGNTVFMVNGTRASVAMTIDANTGSITRWLAANSNRPLQALTGICRDGSNNLWLTDSDYPCDHLNWA